MRQWAVDIYDVILYILKDHLYQIKARAYLMNITEIDDGSKLPTGGVSKNHILLKTADDIYYTIFHFHNEIRSFYLSS